MAWDEYPDESEDYDDPVEEELLDDPFWGWDYGWGVSGPEEFDEDE